jgi:hypothetical protein
MASLVIIALVGTVAGALFGAFFMISLAIRSEDRRRSLQFDPPSARAQAARTVVGVNGFRWD